MINTQYYRDEHPSNNPGAIIDFVNNSTGVSNRKQWHKECWHNGAIETFESSLENP